jgi:hypothetical protein
MMANNGRNSQHLCINTVSDLLDVEGMYPDHARSQIIIKDYKSNSAYRDYNEGE